MVGQWDKKASAALRARDGVRDRVGCGSRAQDVAVIDVGLEVLVACENVASGSDRSITGPAARPGR